MELFFDWASQQKNGAVKQLFSNRLRGGCTYCQLCNTMFQGLGSDASKAAGWLLTKACYIDRDSVLYGDRPVNYIHDEYFIEARLDDRLHEKALEVERLMVQGAKQYLPDLNVLAPPVAMMAWSKEAKAVYDEKGRLVPWRPE